MQNNVTELTQRLLRALDSNYNVINIQEVVEIISLLEKMAITKELLQTTRLGKYVNELRRKTSNADLSRRAKVLVKKWRSLVIPEENGQVRSSPPLQQQVLKVPAKNSPPLQGQAKLSRSSPVPYVKASPPLFGQKVSPGLPGHKIVSPGLPGHKMVSPGLPGHKMVSPGLQSQRLASIQKMVSPSLQKVSPKLTTPLHNPKLETSPPLVAGQSADVNLNQLKNKKRSSKGILDTIQPKRARLNGGVTDLDFSDNSNSSFKDVILPVTTKSDVIMINSDSNSSFSEKTVDSLNDSNQQPKKRGRKKAPLHVPNDVTGSKNHKNLLDEAETSFTNKLAVSASRGSSKVKTTQELLASIQNKNSVLNSALKPKEDLEEKAAKLTERVSIIDQKLNANAHRNKNSQKNKFNLSTNSRNERVIESGSVINDKSLLKRMKEEEEEIVVVDDLEPGSDSNVDNKSEIKETEPASQENVVRSLSVEEAMSLLPPIDKSVLLEDEMSDPPCSCYLKENKPDFSIDDEDVEQPPPFEIIEDPACSARIHLSKKYNTFDTSALKIIQLHETSIENVNGNTSLGTPRPPSQIIDGLYVNIVPNIYEKLDKDVRAFSCETFKKYSVSKGEEEEEAGGGVGDSAATKQKPESNHSESCDNRTGEGKVFREWYECLDKPSYSEEPLRILPYCIVD